MITLPLQQGAETWNRATKPVPFRLPNYTVRTLYKTRTGHCNVRNDPPLFRILKPALVVSILILLPLLPVRIQFGLFPPAFQTRIIQLSHVTRHAKMAQSVCWTVRDQIPMRTKFFCTRPDRPWNPVSLLCNAYPGSFPGVKRPRRGVLHPPPSSAEVKERAELYLCSPSGPLWSSQGTSATFPAHLIFHLTRKVRAVTHQQTACLTKSCSDSCLVLLKFSLCFRNKRLMSGFRCRYGAVKRTSLRVSNEHNRSNMGVQKASTICRMITK